MAERDQRAVTDDEIEAERRDGKDHHPYEQADQMALPCQRGGGRQQRQGGKDHDRRQFGAGSIAPAVGERGMPAASHLQRPLAGNSPAGRT
jgi:hypothetical protein